MAFVKQLSSLRSIELRRVDGFSLEIDSIWCVYEEVEYCFRECDCLNEEWEPICSCFESIQKNEQSAVRDTSRRKVMKEKDASLDEVHLGSRSSNHVCEAYIGRKERFGDILTRIYIVEIVNVSRLSRPTIC